MNIILKSTNSPTQGQPNPRKIRLKVAFWATFFAAAKIIFGGLGLISYRKQATKIPTQTKFLHEHPVGALSEGRGQMPKSIDRILGGRLFIVCIAAWPRQRETPAHRERS